MDIGFTTHVSFRDNLGRFRSEIDEGAKAAMFEASEEGAEIARGFAPKKTGRMAATIQPFASAGGQGGWAVGTSYALDQEFGTSPHEIGGPGQFLENEEDGFEAQGPVEHPGNPATHFMQKSYDFMRGRLLGIIKRHMP